MTLTLRPATLTEADSIAVLFRQSRTTCLPFLPTLHTPEEDRAFFSNHVLRTETVWLAEEEGKLLGFCAFHDGWINHLYIHPRACGRGIGSQLLAKAQEANNTLQLWVFQANTGAIRFYEKHGFSLVEKTDGSRNEENTPDALYTWARKNTRQN